VPATNPIQDVAGNDAAALSARAVTNNTLDTTAPTVVSVNPPNGATGVASNTAVTVTFSENMDASTISTSTIELRNTATDDLIVSTVNYNATTRAATLTPSSSLAEATSYTVRVLGGSTDPRVKDLAGNALATTFTSSFTTTTAVNCPCSLWSNAVVPEFADSGGVGEAELGVKVRSDISGYITGIRFFKATTNTGTHVANLWSNTGTLLASTTFFNETASGWQQVDFLTPVAIAAGTTYVASYHTTTGHWSLNGDYFLSEYVNAPLRAPATGDVGGNGVYLLGASGFPTQTSSANNYWVDVIFSATLPQDTTPPTVVSVSPSAASIGVDVGTNVTAKFSESMAPATITTSTFELRDPDDNIVPATVTYDLINRAATLDPNGDLANSTTYTAVVKGGASGVKDLAENAMSEDFLWTFSTAAPPPPPIDQGPGGPILVVSSGSNPFTKYYAEILRAEGMNEFSVADIGSINATILNGYNVVILGEMSLTPLQVGMFSDWVTAGGNLIAMKPDKQLSSLLGLTDTGSTLSNAYMLVDTSAAPGSGIVGQTMQFHGTADLYDLSGAVSVATLYSDSTTPTANPAVTLRSVGSSGGQAAAFTYGLARSIVYTRQGNPAWAGQNRNAFWATESSDMFFGAATFDPQPDWVDLDKVAIPQADEQQRLLANLIISMNRDRMPLPRFWYLPDALKAAVVLTGDEHADGDTQNTAERWDNYLALDPPGCSVEDWECVRATTYAFPSLILEVTDAQAAFYQSLGFELALHVDIGGCTDFTAASLPGLYTTQLAQFAANFPSVLAPVTHRTHCVVWSDWATQPKVELANGIRLDTNYYYIPPDWVQDRPGFFTGSGMPMRFADLDGTMIDVYQAATQMTDESGQTYPHTIDTLLDNALGAPGYYGVFTANVHTDHDVGVWEPVIVSAQARGVPLVSARQMLKWIDGRNGSSFGSFSWDGNTLSFTVAIGKGADGLDVMLPTSVAGGTLSAITLNGAPVPFASGIIKGLSYAMFPAALGNYQATYVP
jgi:hypothetical protein